MLDCNHIVVKKYHRPCVFIFILQFSPICVRFDRSRKAIARIIKKLFNDLELLITIYWGKYKMRGTEEVAVVTTTSKTNNSQTPTAAADSNPHTPRNESAQPIIPDQQQQRPTEETGAPVVVQIDMAATAVSNENITPPKTFKEQIEELSQEWDQMTALRGADRISQQSQLYAKILTLNQQINATAQTESGGYENPTALHAAQAALVQHTRPNMPIVTALTREQQQAKAPTSVRRPKSKPEPVDGRIVAGIKNNKAGIALGLWLLAMAGISDACLRGARFGKLQKECDASANAMRQNNILPEFVILAALVLCAACTAGARFAWRKIIDACYNNPNRIHNGNQYQKISREENGSGDENTRTHAQNRKA